MLLDGAATDTRYHAWSRQGARTYQDVLQRSTNLDATATATENISLIGAGEDDPPRAEGFYERETLYPAHKSLIRDRLFLMMRLAQIVSEDHLHGFKSTSVPLEELLYSPVDSPSILYL